MKGPQLEPDEEVILYTQGGYVNNLRSGWRLGHFYLTDKRLIFFQPVGIIFQTQFSNINNVAVEKRRYAFREKDVLCISYQHENIDRPLKVWIIMADIEEWKKKLLQKTDLVTITGETIDEIANELEPASKRILNHLWRKRHARIDELADLVDAPSHMDVLIKIKEVINPVSQKIIGSPILVFERHKIDKETGQKVLYNWWLVGHRPKVEEIAKEVLLDVFDEGDHVNIIMELLDVPEESISVEIKEDKVTIFAKSPERKYHEEIPLSSKVREDSLQRQFRNGILQLRLEKRGG